MATVNKNFRIKHGLVVEGSTATVNSQNILTETGGDSYILNLVGGATLVKSVDAGVFSVDGSGNLTVNANTFDSYGSASAAQGAAEDYADGLAVNYDPAGSASAAQGAAEDYADGLAVNYDPAGSASSAQTAAQGYADGLASNYDPVGSASAAQTAAQNYADDLINDASSSSSEVWSAYKTSTEIGVAQTAAEAYTDTREGAITTAYEAYADQAELDAVATANAYTDAEVAALVDSAPALLDTLNELAAAIGDNPNYAADLATSVGERVAKAGDTMTGLLVLSADPSANLGAATKQYVDQAEADAISTAEAYTDTREGAITTAYEAYADQAETDAIASAAADATTKANAAQAAAEATAAAANTAQQNGTTSFTAINYNSVAKQVAATTGNIVTAAETTAISWVAADYRSAKFVVKVKNGVHTQVSDLVVTLDTSNNVAVSEYGITYSNGTELAAVTADYSGSDVRIRVTPANANTEVIVVGTLIK
jgi:hypothetical protein